VNGVDVALVVLDGLAAGHHHYGTGNTQNRAVPLTVLGNVLEERRMMIDHALVDNDDEIRWRLIGRARDDVAQEEV